MPKDTSIEVARDQQATFEGNLAIDPEDGRLVRLSFSSEAPVSRSFGLEILGHGPGEVDLSRITSGHAPLLLDHRADLDHQVGTIQSAEISGNRGLAVVRFGKSARAAEILERVRDGEIVSVSVGYRVGAMRSVEDRDDQPTYRVTRWTPLEISLVSIAADGTVGIGRKAASEGTLIIRKDTAMPKDITPELNDRDATRAERARVSEITTMGEHWSLPREAVSRAIDDGVPVDEFRKLTMEVIESRQCDYAPGATRLAMGLDNFGGRADQERALDFSLSRAVMAEASGDWSEAGLEREVAQEIRSQIGRSAEGIYVPSWALAKRDLLNGTVQHRDLLTSTNTGAMLGTEHLHSAFIDSLRPEVPVMELGARVIPGLVQDVVIPRQTAGTSAEWIAEDAAATESTPLYDGVPLAMKQLSANARLTRKMRKQALPALDQIIRDDLRREIAVKLNAAAINGAGTATEPLGLLNTPGIGSVEIGPDGGMLAWGHVTALMAAVENADAGMGELGFLSNYKVKGRMLSTPKFESGDTAILEADRKGAHVAGYRALFTSLVPSDLTKGSGTSLSALIFGNWSDMLIGQWGGMDLIVDDVTESTRGNIRVTIHSEWDIAIRHPESFAAITEIAA